MGGRKGGRFHECRSIKGGGGGGGGGAAAAATNKPKQGNAADLSVSCTGVTGKQEQTTTENQLKISDLTIHGPNCPFKVSKLNSVQMNDSPRPPPLGVAFI